MIHRNLLPRLFILCFTLAFPAASAAPPASRLVASPPPDELTQLSLDVTALRTLYVLNFTPDQLRSLKSLAHDAADAITQRKPAHLNDKLKTASPMSKPPSSPSRKTMPSPTP